MQVRNAKAAELADRGRCVQQKDDSWLVFSLNSANKYQIVLGAQRATCTCTDWETRQADCKHVLAVKLIIERQASGIPLEPPVTDTPPVKFPRPTYEQDWPNYNAAQEDEKDEFQRLLSDLCRGLQDPAPKGGSKGGRPKAPLSDVLFATLFKVFSTLSGRRFASDLRAARDRGHVSQVVNHCTIARCLESKETTPILLSLITKSSLPLQAMEEYFAVDSSGFSGCRFDRWYDQKYGRASSERVWVKSHIISGTTTHIVAAIDLDRQDSADSPHFVPLVKAAAQHFTIREVAGDKAYQSGANFQVVEDIGGTAYLAFKVDTTGETGGIFARMFNLFCLNKDEYMTRYHRRSNVESVFSAVKRKFGDFVRSKSDVAMKNEAIAKFVCHNLSCLIHTMYELGIEPDLTARPRVGEQATLKIADYR